jgi:hypothetical protein
MNYLFLLTRSLQKIFGKIRLTHEIIREQDKSEKKDNTIIKMEFKEKTDREEFLSRCRKIFVYYIQLWNLGNKWQEGRVRSPSHKVMLIKCLLCAKLSKHSILP